MPALRRRLQRSTPRPVLPKFPTTATCGAWRGQSSISTQSVTLSRRLFFAAAHLEALVRDQRNRRRRPARSQLPADEYGLCPIPWSWAAHPLFAVEAGRPHRSARLDQALRLEGSGGNAWVNAATTVHGPSPQLADWRPADLSARPSCRFRHRRQALRRSSERRRELVRPRAALGRLRIRVSFDTDATPYLGLWICYGGWPDRPGPKQVCVALEPATAPVDSLAINGPWSRTASARCMVRLDHARRP